MRCRYSAEGLYRLQRPQREGDVRWGVKYARVRWDGCKGRQSYAKIFIEIVPVCDVDLSRAPILRELLNIRVES